MATRTLIVALLLIPCFARADDPCDLASLVQRLRPGAAWSLKGTTYAGLNWQDADQAKPTPQEIAAQLPICQARNTQVQQARLDIKNTGLTQAQRIQALLIFLNLDQ